MLSEAPKSLWSLCLPLPCMIFVLQYLANQMREKEAEIETWKGFSFHLISFLLILKN